MPSHLGDMLKKLRANLSLYDIEKGTGLHRYVVSKYETGKNIPSVEQLKILAEFYEYPYQALRKLYFEDLLMQDDEDWLVLATLLVEKALEKEHCELWSAIKNLSSEQRVQFRNLALAHLEESEG